MTSINSSVDVYIEVSVFAASAMIIMVILSIELISWYFETQTKSVTTDVENSHQIDIKPEPSAPNPSTSHRNPASNSSTLTCTVSAATRPRSLSSETVRSSGSSIHPIMRVSPIITYISYICYATTAITAKLGIGLHRECNAVALPSFFYMLSKSCLYLVLLHRIYLVYSNTVFQKNTTILKIAAVFTISFGLLISILNVLLLDVQMVETDGSVYCIQTSNPILVLLFILFDIIMNIGCCYSFTRPLLWLTRMESSGAESATIYNTVVKYTILTVVTVCTTFLSLLLLITVGIQWIPAFDVTVNAVCVMLFNKNYHGCYERMCCGAHRIGHTIIQMECCCGLIK